MKQLLTTLLVFFWLIPNEVSYVMAGDADALTLPGHIKTSESVLIDAADVVVAVFTFLGNPGTDLAGAISYSDAQIEITSTLAGKLSGRVSVSYLVRLGGPGGSKENAPQLGKQYIMLIEQLVPAENRIRKLLPATDKNIAEVKALIASKTAH